MDDETATTATNVLLVEDEDDIRELMQELLELEGFRVDVAANGQEGLDRLRARVSGDLPSVILLDLMMPVKDGFAFRAEQEEDARLARIPVIVMSADAHIEEKRLKLGAAAAVRKPVDFERLFRLLRQSDTLASRPEGS